MFARIEQCRSPEAKLLVVAGPAGQRRDEIVELVAGDDVQTTVLSPGDSTAFFDERQPACVVLAVTDPCNAALELLDEICKRPALDGIPLIAVVLDEVSLEDEQRLERAARNSLLKDVRSPERLLDETALCLHRAADQMPPAKLEMLQRMRQGPSALAGRKVLIVDDDIRNIFAMASLLERQGMHIVTADTGLAALERLADTPDIDVVLMDIMMPTMDGYSTISRSGSPSNSASCRLSH